MQRQKWIIEDKPLVCSVLSTFPPLQESKLVTIENNNNEHYTIILQFLQLRKEFRNVIDTENLKLLKEEWPEWMTKVIKFARLDACSRPLINRLLQDLDEESKYEYVEGKPSLVILNL